jgi:hypothetical protein
MNTNHRLDPKGNSPVNNIADPFKHNALWDEFITNTGTLARKQYMEHKVTSVELGLAVRKLSLSSNSADYTVVSSRNAVTIAAFAYHLRLREVDVREFATAAVALHHPREEIFELVLSAKFGLIPADFNSDDDLQLRNMFDAWLATFGPDVLPGKGY